MKNLHHSLDVHSNVQQLVRFLFELHFRRIWIVGIRLQIFLLILSFPSEFFQKSNNKPKFRNLIFLNICKFFFKNSPTARQKRIQSINLYIYRSFTHQLSIILKIIKRKKEKHEISKFISGISTRSNQLPKSNHPRPI